uniref:Uncharacterized protein n=1 Tax=Sphaerodactylus townsendi TaxID=933632 RepID=A0ACB8FGB4_9SAUR
MPAAQFSQDWVPVQSRVHFTLQTSSDDRLSLLVRKIFVLDFNSFGGVLPSWSRERRAAGRDGSFTQMFSEAVDEEGEEIFRSWTATAPYVKL